MATCDCGHGCSSGPCPNGCGCIYWHDTGRCDAWCVEDKLPPRREHKLTDKVNACISEARLSDVAMFLDNLVTERIAVPAAKANTSVSLSLRDTSLGEVLKAFELVTL